MGSRQMSTAAGNRVWARLFLRDCGLAGTKWRCDAWSRNEAAKRFSWNYYFLLTSISLDRCEFTLSGLCGSINLECRRAALNAFLYLSWHQTRDP